MTRAHVIEETYAEIVRSHGPLESWRMPSWDERDGYYEDGTVLRAEEVPIYRPLHLVTMIPPYDEASEAAVVRNLLLDVAPIYRLGWAPIERLRPFERETPYDLAWIEKFVDLIRRGFEPPPIICELGTGQIFNGSVRTHALRDLGRTKVHAWMADRGLDVDRPPKTRLEQLKERAAKGDAYAVALLARRKEDGDG